MRLTVNILAVILLPVYCLSQNKVVVQGSIMDTLSRPIEAASVIIYSNDKKKIIAFAASNNQGNYIISTFFSAGEYLLEVTAINFQKQGTNLTITERQENYRRNIVLRTSHHLLKEVVVAAKPTGVKAKGDTTEYNAAHFRDGNTKTLEDLLKKLPGVTVNDDGKVTIKGKQVEKILVEGDDMFDRKYDLLTKNFTALAIDKIQAIDNYVENALHKGIESSDKIVINISLGSGFKNKLSGNIDAGIGNNGFYDTKSTLFTISKKNKLIAIANHNNVGKMDGNADEYLYDPSSFLKDNSSFLYGGGEANLPDFKTNRFINTKSNLNVVTNMFTISPRIKVKALVYGLYGSQQTSTSEYERYNFSTDVSWESALHSNYTQRPLTIMGSLETDTKLNNSSAIKHKMYYDFQQNKYANTALGSLSFIDTLAEDVINKPKAFYSQLLYTKRLSAVSVLDIHYDFYAARVEQKAGISSSRYFPLFVADNSFRDLRNNVSRKQTYQAVNANYLWLWRKHKLSASVGYDGNYSELATDVLLRDKFINVKKDTGYQLSVNSAINNYFIKVSDAIEWKKILFKVMMRVERSFFDFDDRRRFSSINRSSFFITPGLSVNYRVSRHHNIVFSYNNSASNPSYTNLLPDFYLRSASSFEKGTGEFHRIYKHFVFASYYYTHFIRQEEASVIFSRTTANKSYAAALRISPSLSINTVLPFDGGETTNLNLSLSKFIPFLKMNVKTNLLFSVMRSFNSVNDRINLESKVYSKDFKLSLFSVFSGLFNCDLQAGYHQMRTRIVNNATFNKNNWITASSIFKFQFSKAWFLLLKVEFYKYSQQPIAVFWDGKITFNPPKSKFGYSLILNNILNVRTYSIQAITPLQVSTGSYRVLPFYCLGSLSYRF